MKDAVEEEIGLRGKGLRQEMLSFPSFAGPQIAPILASFAPWGSILSAHL
jgi:hypothetical protein